MSGSGRDECEHGSLRRKCQRCDDRKELGELRAKVEDLKARLKAARHGYRNPYITVQWEAGYRATDLRVKNWRKP